MVMKFHIFFLAIFLLTAIKQSSAQDSSVAVIKRRFLQDSLSFQIYKDLGFCDCLERNKIGSSNKRNKGMFDAFYFDLYDAKYPLLSIILYEELRTDFKSLSDHYVPLIIDSLKLKDEYARKDFTSPFIFCNILFHSDSIMFQNYKKTIYRINEKSIIEFKQIGGSTFYNNNFYKVYE